MVKARLFEKWRLAFSSASPAHFDFYNCETESFRPHSLKKKTNKSVFRDCETQRAAEYTRLQEP